MRAARAAAHRAVAVARHLDEFHVRQGTHELARRLVDTVVASQEARVVVGDLQGCADGGSRARGPRPGLVRGVLARGGSGRSRGRGGHRREQAVSHEAVEELRVVDDVEVPA